jgi:hypothetical protein
MATLYELTDDYLSALYAIDYAETPEEQEAAWAQLEAIEGGITDKAEAYAKIVRNKLAEAEAFKAEKDRLARCQKAAESVAEGLKRRLLDNMLRLQINEIRTGIGKWRIQLNPPGCEVTDPDAVPAEYRIPQPDAIDKKAILKHYRETGELLGGVEITQTEGIRFR